MNETEELTLVPVGQVADWDDMSKMEYLTCVNHQDARYLTKNPWQRGLHFTTMSQQWLEEREEGQPIECPCPFSDLRVIVGPETKLKEEEC
jgi:hypothetical protein